MRILLDTNILVRANPNVSPQGLARNLLLTIVSGPHTLVISMPILVELQRTLTYARVQKRWPLTRDIIENYARALEQAAFIVELPEPWPAVISDPDDDPILQTAVLGQADVLCTRDTAFGHRLVQEVCTAHGIRVMDDISLIDELRHFSDPSRSH